MITITKYAQDKLTSLLQENDISEWGVVLSVSDMHCAGIHYDVDFRPQAKNQEHVYMIDGIRIFIAAEQEGFFEDVTLDWKEEGVSSGLVVINSIEQNIPSKTCGTIHGCGCSATVKIEGTTECTQC